ncbi:single-stranded DNA-binding protein [Clostridium niameyense]|uniref:Single-stranded DNA-binding protein n=1 Tax=Clostridium niameyense TaxID=1622073 RepID=A0A6M0RBF2_9CLOT|nr:single-stranded DNA-binding protein [Clostridium niameyense]NEZ46518.1 single-stranded DNA-binding protein [Clostridium niameyense]
MNKIVLIGRLTKDPELSFIPGSGTATCKFVLAVDRRFKKDGQAEVDFIPIVVWGKQAEATANYMSKGKLVAVNGRIQTRSYEAKDGTRRYVTEVIAEETQFLEWGDRTGNNPNTNFEDDVIPVNDGEIPF